MKLVEVLVALLAYPGLLLAVALGAIYAVSAVGRPWGSTLQAFGAALRHPDGLNVERGLNLASVLLAGVALALLPWPMHPFGPDPLLWLWSWGAFEAAFLLPLLPALRSDNPLVARAALRAAQIGTLGRALLWLALSSSLLLLNDWTAWGPAAQSPLLVHALALLAAAFAYPCATGWGAYAPEPSLTPAGTEQGLDPPTANLAHAARDVCSAALLAASLLALLPVVLLPTGLGLLMVLLLFWATCTLLQRLTGRTPRMTLQAALRNCLWRALPLGAAAAIYLGVMSG
jgi:hypothetical protein